MLTEEQIQFLNRVCPNIWTEENGVILVKGDVDMDDMNLTQIPVQFGQVNGYFDCSSNKLTTLKGSPFIIENHFECESNQLTTLEEGPKEVMNYYSCRYNKLTSLIGAPETHNHNFICDSNQLISLEGCPRYIESYLRCQNNPLLQYLWGIGRVDGYVHYDVHYDVHNEINKWIITCAQKGIIFPYGSLEENINWIKQEQKYSVLLGAPEEIRKYFSPRILNLVDSGVYNESRILSYKKFKLNDTI